MTTTAALKKDQDTLLAKVKELGIPILVDFPVPHAIRVTLNSPKKLNTVPTADHVLYDEFWTTFEELPNLRVAILTGAGRIFCAGADLKVWKDAVVSQQPGKSTGRPESVHIVETNGFLGVSDRSSKKPIICALNGSSYGGGTETLLNCDLVLAPAKATVCLPEPRRSVAAIAGALPRLGRLVPLQRSMQMALLAEPIKVQKLEQWGIVNEVLDTVEQVQQRAVEYAEKILLSAPEALTLTLTGVRKGYESGYSDSKESGLKEITKVIAHGPYADAMNTSENIQEGLKAFSEKRDPKWRYSKL